MFRNIIRAMSGISTGREARRKYNRMRRWMRDRAEARLIVGLYASGMVRRWV
ncbi:hypothetical protein [Geobacter sp. SVR]|uniref:hypothetical protein n=1 Tax=Geobacter sp. SVR TaxID=2495594 RepID=UPI00143EF6EC|nr:hypothetical protein [Geobacter sp. SVR]BCS54528.1 hypothetical protein GSVR_28360 [Geobacter sp. SVR]GCF87128.1 hypothetical protein GSbR_37280 [Geobacter sp. SVR]